MRTTLVIGDDIRALARERGAREHLSIGQVISALARQALRPAASSGSRNGLVLLPESGSAVPVTLEMVNRLRDELPG